MLRKKILLIGLSQDKKTFLSSLESVGGSRKVYEVGSYPNSQEVEIVTTSEQFNSEHICSQALDGYDAVIQLYNVRDKTAFVFQGKIPEILPSHIYVLDLDTETPNHYVKGVLTDLKGKTAYRHQEPRVTSFFASLFCCPRAATATCPERPDMSAISYVTSSK